MQKITKEYANKKWGFVDKLEYLIGFRYDKKSRGLYVPSSIDTIPSGLKGVDIIYVYHYHFPEFIAPDFKGKVRYNIGNIEVPQEWIKEAQKNYQENEEIAKAPRFERFSDSWAVLPDNMHIFENSKGEVCLDLTKTDIKKWNEIYLDGVDKIMIRPSSQRKIARHSGRNIQNPKTKIYE